MKMLAAMLASVFSDEKLSPEDIEKLKQKDVLQSMMEELADYLPAAKEVLIDERDLYLAARIFQAEGKRVVASGRRRTPGRDRGAHHGDVGEARVDGRLAAWTSCPRRALPGASCPGPYPRSSSHCSPSVSSGRAGG